MLQDALEEIGLSKNEALVYLTLSDLGLTSAYRIADKAHLYRTSVYEALRHLIKKGLVAESHVNKKVLYEAGDAQFLSQFLENKRKKLDLAIPQIHLRQKAVMKKTEFQEYKGADAAVNILFHFLDFKEPILVWGVPKTAYSFLKHRIERFHDERLKRKVVMKHIYNSTAYERIVVLKKMRFTKIRILPALYDSEVATNVCGDEVMLVLYKPPLKVILIKDKDIADSYKRYFELLWKNAKKA